MSKLNRVLTTSIAAGIGIAGVLTSLYAFDLPPFRGSLEVTNDAYVRGLVTTLSPQLAGYVADVPVQDYQQVTKGQVIVRIDDRIYRQKLAQSEASLASSRAALTKFSQDKRSAEAQVSAREAELASATAALKSAQTTYDRSQALVTKGVVAQSSQDDKQASLDKATAAVRSSVASLEIARQSLAAMDAIRRSLEASVESAEATVELARIDLDNTVITAPRDGVLGAVGVHPGQYVTAGTQLTSLVPEKVWIVANFKETQLAGMRLGMPVTFTVDALGNAAFTGTIERFSPATGSEFAVLKSDNATGNFTKVTQRLPVRIAIDRNQALAGRLVPGLSVVATVNVRADATGMVAQAAVN